METVGITLRTHLKQRNISVPPVLYKPLTLPPNLTPAAPVVPATTPDPVVRRLGDALARVMADQGVKDRLINVGVEPLTSSPGDFDALMARDREFWVPLIRNAGITLEG